MQGRQTSRGTSRDRSAELIAKHLLMTGLAQTSLRELAAAAGVSDRMLLYYFADKADALGAGLARIAATLTAMLDAAIPAQPRLRPAALIAAAVAVTTDRAVAPYMRLWIEIVAAAARGEAPFVAIAKPISDGFLDWIEARLENVGDDDPRATAAAILAVIDGLALLEVCVGNDLARRAAGRVGNLFGR